MYTLYPEKEKGLIEHQKEDFSEYNGEGTHLRKAQLRMLEIMVEVDLICRRHKIPYWIDYGTLLGAVRHGGFIPWDDDLDISVQKEDYYRLKEVLIQELPGKFAFQDWKNEKNLSSKCAKVRDKQSLYIVEADKMGPLKLNGIFIDIFPVQKVSSVRLKKAIDFWYGRSFRRLRGLNQNYFDLIAAYLIWPIALCVEQEYFFITKFSKKKKIGNVFGGLNLPCIHETKDIFPLQEIEFEGKFFYAPKNTDRHLTVIYKDYMRIPSKENRLTHASDIHFLDS